jgi:hypothetical protein
MYHRAATQERKVADVDVASEENGVRQHDAIAHSTIVRDMAPRHEKAIGAHRSRCAHLGRPIDGHMLANHRSRADSHARAYRSVEAEILRIPPQYRIGMYYHPFLEVTMPANDRVGVDHASGIEVRTLFNDGRGVDLSA